ncbi:MAG: hypothetical protein LBI78_07515 [Campylobacteraceae bacterium]|nr:hypothetical protein [Campylobacteraceae bacterium]
MKTIYQNRLYHGLIKQLHEAQMIKIQFENDFFKFRPQAINKDSFRYLLKVLDGELKATNTYFPEASQNKNEFCDASKEDLQHHISWLKEVLWDNKIVPFDDEAFYKDF